MARMMALCSLPRTNPGNRLQYKRVNGPYKLIMFSSGETKLPYGNFPRLLLAWVCTEAVRTQSRELILGKSLSEFMKTLGVYTTDGKAHTRLRNQMKRLFHAQVEFIYKDGPAEQFIASRVADRGEFWWDPKRPEEPMLWDSKIRLGACRELAPSNQESTTYEPSLVCKLLILGCRLLIPDRLLGEEFFHEIIRHPVPLDMNTLKALKRCALGLDLYLWLTYRTFALRAPPRLTWKQVYRQFGPNPNNAATHDAVQNCRRRILRELKKIKLAWPGLNYSTAKGVLILHPSTPVIAPLNQGQLGR